MLDLNVPGKRGRGIGVVAYLDSNGIESYIVVLGQPGNDAGDTINDHASWSPRNTVPLMVALVKVHRFYSIGICLTGKNSVCHVRGQGQKNRGDIKIRIKNRDCPGN